MSNLAGRLLTCKKYKKDSLGRRSCASYVQTPKKRKASSGKSKKRAANKGKKCVRFKKVDGVRRCASFGKKKAAKKATKKRATKKAAPKKRASKKRSAPKAKKRRAAKRVYGPQEQSTVAVAACKARRRGSKKLVKGCRYPKKGEAGPYSGNTAMCKPSVAKKLQNKPCQQ